MSEEEMFAAQGRAHARAKTLRSEIATARAELQRQASILEGLHRRLKQGPQDAALVIDLRFTHKSLLADLASLTDSVLLKSRELQELESEIEKF